MVNPLHNHSLTPIEEALSVRVVVTCSSMTSLGAAEWCLWTFLWGKQGKGRWRVCVRVNRRWGEANRRCGWEDGGGGGVNRWREQQMLLVLLLLQKAGAVQVQFELIEGICRQVGLTESLCVGVLNYRRLCH